MENIIYYYAGLIERPQKRKNRPATYGWFEGYSLGKNGSIYPWVTKKEARKEARRMNKKAVFIESNEVGCNDNDR